MIMIESYRDMTIAKYMEIMDILDEATDETELVVSLIAALSEQSEDEIERLPLKEFNKRRIKAIELLKTKPKTDRRIPNKIKIGEKSYRIEKDCFSISAGQYIDYRGYLKSVDDLKNNLHRILSVFIIPEGCEYGEGYDLNEVANEIRDNVSFELATSLSAFFLAVSQNCIKHILQSLKKETIRTMARNPKTEKELTEALMEIQRLNDLVSNGVGLIGQSE